MSRLHTLTLTSFRSYAQLRLDTGAEMILLTGANGAGKTNILEAISLLSPGRGLRGAKLAELQKFGDDQAWAVSADIGLSPDQTTTLGTGRDPAAEDSNRRIVMIEGQRTTPAALTEYLAVSWLTPAMDRLWADSPSSRRRFLDRLTSALDPAHATRLNRYDEALSERNRLLKDGRTDDKWLSSIEHVLATEGMAVAAARRELVQNLQSYIASTPSDFPQPQLTIDGIENWLDDGPALLMEDKLREELAKARRFDGATGITSLGPHRSDLQASHPEKNMPAALCSTGEQKALLVSLVLAHAGLIRKARGHAPVLLLDEIAAHLDEKRRESLYNTLFSLQCQVWLSGADSALFNTLSGRILCYEIGAGFVRETAPA